MRLFTFANGVVIVSRIVSSPCAKRVFNGSVNRFMVTPDILTALRLHGRLQADELLKSLGWS